MINSRTIQVTEDGSHTIFIDDMHVMYHSKHGAIQESNHIFINEGLHYSIDENKPSLDRPINIFEVGFGTGLNGFLSLDYAIQHHQKINYQTIELFPLSIEQSNQLNYASLINEDLKKYFSLMHECAWNKAVQLHPLFSFQKIKAGVQQFETNQKFHVIYFDAFDPTTQPELWTEEIFKKMFDMLYNNGILVTYCSKGVVRRAMQTAGFTIEKLKGPKGKREIVRALKNF